MLDNNMFVERSAFKKCSIYISFTLICFILLTAKFPSFTGLSLYMVCFIGLTIMAMFTMHIRCITNNTISKIIQMQLTIIIISYFISFFPSGELVILKKIFLFSSEIGFSQYLSINFTIVYYFLSRFFNKDLDKRGEYTKYISIMSINIILNLSYNYNVFNRDFLIIVYLLFEIKLLISTISNINYPVKYKEKINVLKLISISVLICLIFHCIFKIFKFNLLNTITALCIFIVYTVCLILIIKNIIENTYNYVFQDTYVLNKNLEEINEKLYLNNLELERGQKIINQRKNNYKNFLELLPKPIILINRENCRINYCNKKALDIIGENDIRFIINKKLDFVINFEKEFKNISSIDIKKIYRGVIYKEAKRSLNIKFFKIKDLKSEMVVVIEDITDQILFKKMQDEIHEKKYKEVIKKEFLSNISHDVKIPINVIYSAMQLQNVLIEKNSFHEIKKYNKICLDNSLTIIKLTNNLIDIGKIGSESLKAILERDNIVTFVEDKLFLLIDYIKSKGLEFAFDTYEEELYVDFDKELVERIILNIISNSVKFTKEGGKIEVTIKNDDNYIFLEFKDTGIGMSEEFIKQAFNRYSMEKKDKNIKATGSGVGLFVVYNLAKIQGAEIQIESKLNYGTCIVIKFSRVKKDE